MNGLNRKTGVILSSLAATVAITQPAIAAQTEITNVQLIPSGDGVQLSLQVQGNARPPVFSVNRGNSSIIDISNAQLRLSSGSGFSQPNPTVGIRNLEIQQLDADTVRIIAEGEGAAPLADVTRRDANSGILTMTFSRPSSLSGGPIAGGAQVPASGQTPNAVPPFQTKATAPPVGDIAVGAINANPERVELGSSQIIPKLLLRDAPVREVLTLLGRAAGANVAFAEESGGEGGPTISLDIENESVDDVFNYVIRLTGLQANRVGQTIFVGRELPGDAQNRIVRTFRLNQMKATTTTTITKSISSSADTGGSVGQDGGGGTTAQTAISREATVEDSIEGTGAKEILESYGANGNDGVSSLLRGLEVVADARTNSITLIGTPNKVGIASQLITQLDVRKRQVAVNVKFIDVNLSNTKESNADLQFGFNNFGIGIAPGTDAGAFNATGANGNDGSFVSNVASGLFTTNPVTSTLELTRNFIGSIFAEVQNSNAKILTNPTLLVQEGSSAQVNLTEQVFTGFETTVTSDASASGATTTGTTTRPIIQNAGVILNVTVDQIDDNGFVTMSLSPEVSSLGGTFQVDDNTVASLLQQRRLETGQLRMRDGQTLILSGIIQDEDRATVSKVPILGDIPLLGKLFRSDSNVKVRSELVVLVTPQILDDSDASTFGYQYSPSTGVSPLLRN